MPATYAAARSALGRCAQLTPEFRPRTQLDVGGGTGATVWAAAETWPSLQAVTVLERVPALMGLGERLAATATSEAVRRAVWHPATIGPDVALPGADLVTMSYVLGEVPQAARSGVVGRLAASGAVVALIEPGTPDGYDRVIAARDLLIALGMTVVAPCPHDLECPIPRGRDWCHFSVRVDRSPLHRRTKAATLGFEDEKFSYVVASAVRRQQAANRVVRHPQQRKGLVSLRLCTAHDGLATQTVSRRQGDVYRAARRLAWGDAWPPLAGATGQPGCGARR